jgi:hypothetical protein
MTPFHLEGARRLTQITTSVKDPDIVKAKWRVVRRVSLGYDATALRCDQNGAPLRYLTQIAVAAFDRDGTERTLPPITFEYGRKWREFNHTVRIDSPGFAHYGTRHGATGMAMDLNADGISDLVKIIQENGVCKLEWQKGRFGGGFEKEKQHWELPTWAWLNGEQPSPPEFCSLSRQRVLRPGTDSPGEGSKPEKGNIDYHFLDYTGDGRVDLLTSLWAGEGAHSKFPPPSLLTPVSDRADDLPTGVAPVPLIPEEVPGRNQYVWRVYRNSGSALYSNDSEPLIVHTPCDPLDGHRPFLSPSASDRILIRTYFRKEGCRIQ